MKRPFQNILLLSLGLFALSCIKDEGEFNDLNIDIQPEFGVPIVQASISAERLIENFDDNNLVSEGANGQITLIYADSITTFLPSDFIDVPNQDFGESYTLSSEEADIINQLGQLTISFENVVEFSTDDGDVLDFIGLDTLKSIISLSSESDILLEGSISILTPEGDVSLQINFSDTSLPINSVDEATYTDVLLDLINEAPITNGLRIVYEITFSSSGQGPAVPGTTSISLSFQDLIFGSGRGAITPREITIDELSLPIDLFSEDFDGEIFISDPRLLFFFENSFKMELAPVINQLVGLTDEEDIVIEGEFINQLGIIPAAESAANPVDLTYMLTNDDVGPPTISDFLEAKPNTLISDLSMFLNPNGEPVSEIFDESELNISVQVEIPVAGTISNFFLIDTLEADLGDLIQDANENEEVRELIARLIVNNGYPLDTQVQIVFTDSLFQPVDSLFDAPEVIFSSAPINTSVPEGDPNFGRATGKTKTLVDIAIENERITDLEEVTHLIVRVTGDTSMDGETNIRLFADDSFDFSLGAELKFDFRE